MEKEILKKNRKEMPNIRKAYCADKSVEEIIDKIKSYMLEQHTQPNCADTSYARGWRDASAELEHFLRQEFNLK